MNKFIGSFIVLFFSFSGYAQEKTTIKDPLFLKTKLKQQAKETTSIIANFTQEKHMSFMNKPQFSEGVLYFQQSDKMRWEQIVPYNYVLLINQGKVRIKDNGREKKITGANKMMGKINELMIGLINGELIESEEFKAKYYIFGEFYVVELTPTNQRLKSVFNTIELTFSKNTIHLKQLIFFESSGDKSVMKFFNEKFNQPIQQSIFITL
jgi:outer membrane lipoprotein-sorting protein